MSRNVPIVTRPSPRRRSRQTATTAKRPQPRGWTIPLNTVITRAGSRVGDMEWDFRMDQDDVGLFRWDAEVESDGIVVGRLSDLAFRELLTALQRSVAVRWRYARREDGKTWNAQRAFKAAYAARRFGVFAAAAGVTRPSQITEALFLAWVRQAALTDDGRQCTNRHWREMVDPPLLIWRVRDRIDDTLGFAPRHAHATEWTRDGKPPTSIPLIPKPVLDHVIGAAVRYVEVYAHDIRAARRYVDRLAAEWEQRFGRPQPAYRKGCPEYRKFDSWLGRRFGYRRPKARAAMKTAAPWNADGLFLRDPDTGEPWLEHIRTRHHLQQLENSLRTACYIVIAFTTAGRNSDMNRLKTDCARVVEQVDGRPNHHVIHGTVTKHRGRRPEPAEWVVPEVTVTAARLLVEMLAAWRAKTNSDRLFVTQTGKRVTDRLINFDLKVFLDRIGAPYIGGKPFPIATHMFRVALAQWLGAEPYGEIAGVFHLKQLGTAAFRGYLREDPHFRSLFEAFEVQAQADHLALTLEEPVLLGRKGQEIMAKPTPAQQAALEANVRALNLAQVGREAPSERLMMKYKKSGRPVYRTNVCMCFFAGETAECLKHKPLAERLKPLTHKCEPITCANAALTRWQVPFYLEDFEAYAAMTIDPSQSPSQIALAHEEMGKLAKLIAPFISTFRAEKRWLEDELVGADEREAETVAMCERKDMVVSLLDRIERGGVEELARAA